ncbi:hypothetical protein O6P43_001550 [Quillaja saponaria]|uniref:Uncharacterized protein n=1 Tax=Quillaja saponaria TaxID=32244 RepID=A0AAD7QJ02_QUISA|nr:hypothetical protein O6P43_001550 [Quillaja saponaria]
MVVSGDRNEVSLCFKAFMVVYSCGTSSSTGSTWCPSQFVFSPYVPNSGTANKSQTLHVVVRRPASFNCCLLLHVFMVKYELWESLVLELNM